MPLDTVRRTPFGARRARGSFFLRPVFGKYSGLATKGWADMTEKQVLVPGPDHPITVTPAGTTVTVRLSGHTIAKTDRALVLQEAS